METGDKELAGLRNILAAGETAAAARSAQYDRDWEFWTGQPRLVYSSSRRWKIAARVRGIRTAIAGKIAPWLTDEY